MIRIVIPLLNLVNICVSRFNFLSEQKHTDIGVDCRGYFWVGENKHRCVPQLLFSKLIQVPEAKIVVLLFPVTVHFGRIKNYFKFSFIWCAIK